MNDIQEDLPPLEWAKDNNVLINPHSYQLPYVYLSYIKNK